MLGYFIDLMICVVIENNIVMIAASIPTLRPLMRKNPDSTGTPGRYYCGSGGHVHSDFSSAGAARRQTLNSRVRSKLGTLDDNSEEYILHEIAGGHQITKTTNVQVAYEQRSNNTGDTEVEKAYSGTWPQTLEKPFDAART